MKTKYEKLAKHIRRINEILDVAPTPAGPLPYTSSTLTLNTLKALHTAERETNDFAFTTNGVDSAAEKFLERTDDF